MHCSYCLNILCSSVKTAFFLFSLFRPLAGNYIGDQYVYYGPSFTWCAVNPEWVYLLLTFVPILFGAILSFYWGAKTIIFIKDWRLNYVVEYKNALVYPIIQFVSWLPAVIDRVYHLFSGNIYFPLLMFHIIFARSQGIINAIFYGKSNYENLRNYLQNGSDIDYADPLYLRYDLSSVGSLSPTLKRDSAKGNKKSKVSFGDLYNIENNAEPIPEENESQIKMVFDEDEEQKS